MPQMPKPKKFVVDLGDIDSDFAGIVVTATDRPDIVTLLESAELRAKADKAMTGKERSPKEEIGADIITSLAAMIVETNATDETGALLSVADAVRDMGGTVQLVLFRKLTDFFSPPSADDSAPSASLPSDAISVSAIANVPSVPETPAKSTPRPKSPRPQKHS